MYTYVDAFDFHIKICDLLVTIIDHNNIIVQKDIFSVHKPIRFSTMPRNLCKYNVLIIDKNSKTIIKQTITTITNNYIKILSGTTTPVIICVKNTKINKKIK